LMMIMKGQPGDVLRCVRWKRCAARKGCAMTELPNYAGDVILLHTGFAAWYLQQPGRGEEPAAR
jgi:hypothetical protein